MDTPKRKRGRPRKTKVMERATPKAVETEVVVSAPEPQPQPEPKATPLAYTEDRPVQHYRAEFADAKNPDMVVRMVRETPKHIQRRERQGYRMAKPEELADHSGWESVDGAVHFGDRVAMIIPRPFVDARTKARMDEDHHRTQEAGQQASGAGFYQKAEHGQRKGSKFYSIP